MNSNQFLNALASDDMDAATTSFENVMGDKLADALEVRKVELASSIFGDEEEINEGEGMDAQRQYARQTRRAINKGTHKDTGKSKSIHTGERKEFARALVKKRGAETVKAHASTVKDLLKGFRKEGYEGEHGAAHELSLYADNDSQLYHTSHKPIIKNLQRKIAKGVYNHEKAKTLWGYHADRAAHKYAKEHGDGTPWHKMFSPSDRKKAAGHFADRAKEELGLNEAVDTGAAPASPRNILQNIRRGIQTLKIKGVNPALAARAHADYSKLVAKNPKAPGYMLARKLAPNKAAAVQALSQSGMPVGQSLEANPADYNQALARVKRFK